MTILVLTPESPAAQLSDVDYARSFELGGMKVLRLDPDVVYQRGGMSALEGEVVRLVNEHSVQTLAYTLGMEFDFCPNFFHETLAHVFKVLLPGDDGQYFDVSHRYYAQCFDLVLTMTPPLCDHYALYGTEAWFIPSVFSRTIFSPEIHPSKEIDVSFIGAMYGKGARDVYARTLTGAGIDLHMYGAGTPAGVVTQQQVIDIYRRSCINLNLTAGGLTALDSDLTINRRVRQIKGRCSKIALCGSFILSEYAPGIEKLFDIGSEIDVFHDEDELVSKVRFYLAHEEVREEMAAKAHARALEQYDEKKFWPSLVDAIEVRAGEKRGNVSRFPLCMDNIFWSAFGAWRFKYMVVFLFSCRAKLFLREFRLLLWAGRFKPVAAVWFAAMGLLASSRTSRLATCMTRAARRLRRIVWVHD